MPRPELASHQLSSLGFQAIIVAGGAIGSRRRAGSRTSLGFPPKGDLWSFDSEAASNQMEPGGPCCSSQLCWRECPTILLPESSPILKALPSSLPPTLHPRLAESSTSQLVLVLRRVLGAPWRAAGASKEALTDVGTTGFQAFLHTKLNPPGPWLEDVLTHGQIPPRTFS